MTKNIFQKLLLLLQMPVIAWTTIGSAAPGETILRLGSKWQYQARSSACAADDYDPEITMWMIHVDGRVIAARLDVLRNGENPLSMACTPGVAEVYLGSKGFLPSEEICQQTSLQLSDADLAGLETFTDSSGKIWLKRLNLTPSTMRWFLYHYAWVPHRFNIWPECPLQHALVDLKGESFPMEFELDGIIDGLPSSYSNPVSAHGVLANGEAARFSMRARQRQ
jgi:hypothetical protein